MSAFGCSGDQVPDREGERGQMQTRAPRQAALTDCCDHVCVLSSRPAYWGQPYIVPSVVDDLQHALPERGVLDRELREEAPVVEAVGSVGLFGSMLFLKMILA